MAKLLPSTQSHLDIIDVQNDLLILRGGKYRLILQTNSVNFDLLSESEQDALIYSYGALVNALNFPVQIVIHTRPTNIASYINYLENYENRQPEGSSLRVQIRSYREFVNKLVMENNVLNKRFFIILPYNMTQVKQGPLDAIFDKIFGRKKVEEKKEQNLDKARVHLEQRRMEVLGELNRMGIKAFQLNNKQLTELFYELYNPNLEQVQQFSGDDISDYTTLSVKPAVE